MNSQIKTNSINIGTRILFVVFESIFVSIFFKLNILLQYFGFLFYNNSRNFSSLSYKKVKFKKK